MKPLRILTVETSQHSAPESMTKKRKASSRGARDGEGPKLDVGESRKRIKDFEDVADSDDEFHINRDRVLLDEEPDAKRRRKWQEQEEFIQPSDEEVLGFSGEDEEDDGVHEDVGEGGRVRFDSASEGSGDEDEDDEEGLEWGISKDDIYGADEIETEEQALEEEAEALRLQKKHLQSMTAADYGFEEAEWRESEAIRDGPEQEDANVVTETLPQLQVGDDIGPVERLKLLKSRYPEFEPLAKELLHVKEQHLKLVEEAQGISVEAPNAVVKRRAASAYLGALTMYFALLASPASGRRASMTAMSASQLRDHPVMDSLVKCREVWQRAAKLPTDPKPSLHEDKLWRSIDAIPGGMDEAQSGAVRARPLKKSRAQRHAEAAQAAAEMRRTERMQRTEADLANLDVLVAPSGVKDSTTSRRKAIAQNGAGSDIGEDVPPTTREAAEKAKHKKSLRFYTSQIAQKANKRGAAGRNAGGDDDIPHRERLKDRQARLNAEAERRGRRTTNAGAELGGESDEEDARQALEIRTGGDGDDYYDLVAARTAKKKADKAAFAEAQRQAALQGGQVIQEEAVGADGKRKISYAIEKNKGLTPHRKKEVRNPRVKKRKKYDETKKKLGSIKPVYKGGEGRGGYGGELTGIKKGLVKSTKL